MGYPSELIRHLLDHPAVSLHIAPWRKPGSASTKQARHGPFRVPPKRPAIRAFVFLPPVR